MKNMISPAFDPWESYIDIDQSSSARLSNIEFTTTTVTARQKGTVYDR